MALHETPWANVRERARVGEIMLGRCMGAVRAPMYYSALAEDSATHRTAVEKFSVEAPGRRYAFGMNTSIAERRYRAKI